MQVLTALALAREALAREGKLESQLRSLAQAATDAGQRTFTLPDVMLLLPYRMSCLLKPRRAETYAHFAHY